MKRTLTGIICAATLSGCAHMSEPALSVGPLVATYVKDHSKDAIKSYQGETSYVVVILADRHSESQCQESHYNFLTEHNNSIKFIAAEGSEGIIKRDYLKDATLFAVHFNEKGQRVADTNATMTTDEIMALSYEEREMQYANWFETRTIPTAFPREAWPLSATELYLLMNPDSQYFGIEDMSLKKKADEAKENYLSASAIKKPTHLMQFRHWGIRKRNQAFQKNISKYLEEHESDEGDLVVVRLGRKHAPSLERYFRRKKVSYVTHYLSECGGPAY